MVSVLSNAVLQTDPYPFAICYPALPWDLYDELERTRPDMNWVLAGRDPGENKRIDMPTRAALYDPHLPDVWRHFIVRHTGRRFLYDVVKLFGPFMPALKYGPYEEWHVAPRGTGAVLSTECQIGVNTPSKTQGKVRGPHLDNPIELYGGLMYMNDDDTEFVIYRLIKKPEFHGKLEINEDCVEAVASVPCSRNMAVFFLNSEKAVHGVTERKPNENPRLLVNFIGELPEPLFSVGHGRY